jgi:predicted AAA+ superfamily ATPase
MYYKRDFEAIIRRLSGLYSAILVTGPRQTGKTELVRHLFPGHRWVLLDEQARIEAARRDPGLFLENHPPPVIFDEIQRAPELLPEIKARIDGGHAAKGTVVLTGSQPLPLMHTVTESLAGRVGIMELPPMTLAEIFDAPGRPRLLQDWLERPPIGQVFPYQETPASCLVRGGFPAMALPQHSPTDADAAQRLGDYIQTYLTRDLRDLAQVHDLGRFERFLRQLAVHSAKLLNLSKLGADVGIPQSTADEWLGLLESSQLIWRAPGYARQHGKRARRGAKVFLCDSGLTTSLLGYRSPDQVLASPLLGALFETAGVAAIRKVARAAGGPYRLFHWRFDEAEEVDLIVELAHDVLVPIEFKLTSKPSATDTQGLAKFRARHGRAMRGVVVSTNTECFWLDKETLHVPWSGL